MSLLFVLSSAILGVLYGGAFLTEKRSVLRNTSQESERVLKRIITGALPTIARLVLIAAFAYLLLLLPLCDSILMTIVFLAGFWSIIYAKL